jgi:hypothetical protein
MPIQLELIKENRVVLQTYSDPVDSTQLNELREHMDLIILPATTGKIHIIADFRGVKNLSGPVISLGAQMLYSRHLNTGMLVCITTNPLIIAMINVVSGLIPRQSFAVVSSFEAADNIIDQVLQPVNT